MKNLSQAVLLASAFLLGCNGEPEPGLQQNPDIKAVAPGYAVDYHVRWNNDRWALDTPDCISYSGTCDEQTFALRVDCGALPCEVSSRGDGAALVEPRVVRGEIRIIVKPLTTGTLAPRFLLTHGETGEEVVLEAEPIRVLAPAAIAASCRFWDNSGSSESSPCGQTVPLLESKLPAATGTRLGVFFRVTAADGTALLTGATPSIDGQASCPGSSWQCASNPGARLEDDGQAVSLSCGVLTRAPMRSTLSLEVESLVASVSVTVEKR